MEINCSLIKTGDVQIDGSKAGAAGRLLEKIVGVFSPKRQVEMALADAEASRIRVERAIENKKAMAVGGLDLEFELLERAAVRSAAQQARHQENIEQVTRLAIQDLSEDAAPERIDDDWMSHFFERSRNVSNAEMQALWARILAGEANKPGSIAKRTLDFLASMDRAEGLAFANLVNFGIAGDDGILPIVTDCTQPVYSDHTLGFDALSHLESIGLIKFQTFGGFQLNGVRNPAIARYGAVQIEFSWPDGQPHELALGQVILTRIGKELVPVCERTEIRGFLQHLLDFWTAKGVKVRTVNPPPDAFTFVAST